MLRDREGERGGGEEERKNIGRKEGQRSTVQMVESEPRGIQGGQTLLPSSGSSPKALVLEYMWGRASIRSFLRAVSRI